MKIEIDIFKLSLGLVLHKTKVHYNEPIDR